MRFCHLLWLMALLGLTGCATPQAPSTRQQAALTIPDAWKAPQTAGPHLVDDGWLSRFQDAHLSKLVDEALLNNRDLQAAAARVALAEARARQVGASLLPTVDLTGGTVTSGAVNTNNTSTFD